MEHKKDNQDNQLTLDRTVVVYFDNLLCDV